MPGGAPAAGCAATLDRNVTAPTTLVDRGDGCDYLLDGFVEVRSTLVIEPGVTVLASQDSTLWVDGGAIVANGTPDRRIRLAGLNAVAGYWHGIRFAEGRESSFANVDVADGGQVCTILFCPDAAVFVDAATLTFTDSTVSNSYVHGLQIARDVDVREFARNRFFANTWAGIVVDGNQVPTLDADSDYAGADAPNGTPYVLIGSGSQERGEVFDWKALSAPYLIGSYFDVEGGTLRLEPGTTVLFGAEGWMDVKGNGELVAVGTAERPIRFLGLQAEPGWWDGITFSDSYSNRNALVHVQVSHAGNTENLVSAWAGVRLEYDSYLYVSDSLFTDNAQWGIWCDEGGESVGMPTLELGPDVYGRDNGAGNLGPDC